MKKTLFLSLAFIFIVFTVFIFTPVPIPTEDKCLRAEGIVDAVFEAGEKDVVIRLKESNKTYYINRGVEQGLDLEDLKIKLLNNRVVIKYPKYWTPLDPQSNNRHIARLNYGDEVIYNEME